MGILHNSDCIMNQRSKIRCCKEIDVWLYQNDNLIVMAKTENLTKDGMYIKTDGLIFPKDSAVEVAFLQENGKPKKHIKAKVVHRTLTGIGVTFDDNEEI